MTAGSYTVTAMTAGVGCTAKLAATDIDVDTAVTLDLLLAPQADLFGYACKSTPSTAFIQGTTKLALDGDDVTAVTGLPFAIPYYGTSYDKMWVSSTGVATFIDPPDGYIQWWSVSLPDRTDAPRAAVIPFLDYLTADARSGIWTGTIGTGGSQRFVVEWRDMVFDGGGNARFSFEAIFSPNGDITFNYSGLTTDDTKGANAAVGITSPGGGYGLQYLFQEPALADGTAVTFLFPEDPQPIPYGSVSGTVSANGVPYAQSVVILENNQTRTDDAGNFRFDNVEAGSYNLETWSGCDGVNEANVEIQADTTMDLHPIPIVDDFGYACKLESTAWIPTDTVLPGSGADITLPFAFPFYGDGYPTAQMNPGGVYLRKPGDSRTGGDLEFWPGANVSFDAQSSLRTATLGTAPNRRFVFEVRDIPLVEAPAVRVTFEYVFAEDGTVTMTFMDPPDPALLPYRIRIYWYKLGGSATIYEEDGRGLLMGNAVVFRPPTS